MNVDRLIRRWEYLLWGRCTFTHIQLFGQKLSRTCVKANSTMAIGIMGSDSLVFLDWRGQCFRNDEMPLASIKQPLARITHNTFWHCCVRFYTFVGQPFLKKLYHNKYVYMYLASSIFPGESWWLDTRLASNCCCSVCSLCLALQASFRPFSDSMNLWKWAAWPS